jgi:hypothetical protein
MRHSQKFALSALAFVSMGSASAETAKLETLAKASSLQASYQVEQLKDGSDYDASCVLQLSRRDLPQAQLLSLKHTDYHCDVSGAISIEIEDAISEKPLIIVRLRRGGGCDTSAERVVVIRQTETQLVQLSEIELGDASIEREQGQFKRLVGRIPLYGGIAQVCTGPIDSDCPGLPASLDLQTGLHAVAPLDAQQVKTLHAGIAHNWLAAVKIGELTELEAAKIIADEMAKVALPSQRLW